MADRIKETMDGTLGHFWTDINNVHDLDKSDDGYARLVDGSLFHVSTLRTREFNDWSRLNERLPRPEVVYGMTAATRSLFFDIAGVAQNNVMGPRASTQTLRTRGVVVDVPFELLQSTNFLAVEVRIPEVTTWSGLQGVSETVRRFEDNRPKTYTAATIETEPLEIEIRRGLKLTLDTTWSVDGPDDKRTLSTPLVVSTESKTPRTWDQHLVPLIAVQDLINLAYEGFVPAERGTVKFKCRDDGRPRSASQVWNSRLMTVPRGVSRPNSMSEYPLFHLHQIGGVRGVRNWIRLDHRYPRATGPIANTFRYGTTGAEVRLIEIALALEYWTSVHKKLGREWAKPRKRKKANEPLPMSVGRHVGPAFTEFVGDLDKWSDLFWNTYRSLKHAPSFEYDPIDVQILGDAGALLLLGELLNRVAETRQPMDLLCRSHRTEHLIQNVRRLVESAQ
ncbi:hypothetical protein [Mycobacterium sp.]|uniref:ApeA N-terminal domain 1-containing protein n=1 Tax=Mycobacterium sp. TaxID=1785 RepID=UPI003D126F0C